MSCRPLTKPLLVFYLLLALSHFSGCGGSAPPPQVAPDHVPGYEALREEFGNLDFTPLAGRRIVIDPGHGGVYRGAVGPRGLTEAEVNLGVGLYLGGLLEWAGAQVHLTRTADYDFLSPADSTLSTDLAFRVSITDSLQPDVFISIHHNSTASMDPTINETQTYYPLGDDGASLDLARSIHRHLALNLDIRPARILPGNFHVLRNATVPAVLGEPAMISNPVMEGRLSLAASQELEAQAYFLGLLDYFSAGTPHWQGAVRDTLAYDPAFPPATLSWTFLTGSDSEPTGPAPDPGSFALRLNGRPEPFALSADGYTVTWHPTAPVTAPILTFSLTGRNLRGRATPTRETVLRRDSARTLQIRSLTDTASAGVMLLTWSTSDGLGQPGGTLDLGATTLDLPPGTCRGSYILPKQFLTGTAAFTARENRQPWSVDILSPVDLPAPRQWREIRTGGPAPAKPWLPRIETAGPAAPFALPPGIILTDTTRPIWWEHPGFLPLVSTTAGATMTVGDRTWAPTALLPGLQGLVVMLDASGGGTDTQGLGPLGTRGADLNLATARQAARLLRGAGAEVYLTRSGDMAPDNPTKVRLATDLGANLFLTISRGGGDRPLTIRHHHGSIQGERWAANQLTAAAALADTAHPPLIEPSYAYLLRHTACPALEVVFPGPETGQDEMRLEDPAWQMAEARALLLAAAATWNDPRVLARATDPATLIRRLPGAPAPAAVDWARLDGNFDWVPPRTGAVTPSATGTNTVHSGYGLGWPLPRQRHLLEIHAGRRWQLWLIEIDGDTLHSTILLETP